MNPSKIFLFSCLSFIFGVSLSSFFYLPTFFLLIFFFLPLIFTIFQRKFWPLFLFFLFFLSGIFYLQFFENKISKSNLFQLNNLNVKFTGLVIKEPDLREKTQRLTLKIEKILEPIEIEKEEGKVLIILSKYPSYHYGDLLLVEGKLEIPQNFSHFNFKDYLAKDGIYSLSYWPSVKLLSQNQGNPFYISILKFKERLREGIYKTISPPPAFLLGAMILGDKRQISEEFKEKLNFSGLRHLTAVSGMHVMIFALILNSIFVFFKISRKKSFFLTLSLISFFIILTGFQNSAIRAGIITFFLLLGDYFGRITNSRRALVFALFLMLLFNPLNLRYDVGFQLSFLAAFGIAFLSPSLKKIFFKRDFLLKEIFIYTLSAQIFTLPLLIYQFGYFSKISLLSNLLVLPILPFILGFGFLLSLSAIFSPYLALILGAPSIFLLFYLDKIIQFFSSLPFSYEEVKISPIFLFLSYLFLGILVFFLEKKFNQPLLKKYLT